MVESISVFMCQVIISTFNKEENFSVIRIVLNTMRIKSSENNQQPGVSRSGCSQWEEAKLGSAVEKLEDFNTFFFHQKLPLKNFWGLHDKSAGLHTNKVYILCVHIWMHLVRNVLSHIWPLLCVDWISWIMHEHTGIMLE